jgi:hypothetical protein
MRARTALLAGVAAGALTASVAVAAPPAPQVTDAAGDANFLGMALDGGMATPVGSQAYADVLSVTWTADKTTTTVKKKKVTTLTGFTVTTVLSAPPTPPAGTSLVFRMLGTTDKCPFVGPVFYTQKSSDPGIPQAAMRDNCTGTTRLTEIPMPVVDGATITWKVPLSALPKEVPAGTTLKNLFFEVNEIEDFRGAQVPAGVPLFGGVYGLGTGQVDAGKSESSFLIG